MVWISKSVDETLVCDHIKFKILKSTFVWDLLFIVLYKVVLTFKSVDKALVWDH